MLMRRYRQWIPKKNLYSCILTLSPSTQLLYDTFSAFGVIVNTPKIMRDPETGNSRGFGFVRSVPYMSEYTF